MVLKLLTKKSRYIKKILQEFKIEYSNLIFVPLNIWTKLKKDIKSLLCGTTYYRLLIESLIHLKIRQKDIIFIVYYYSQYID